MHAQPMPIGIEDLVRLQQSCDAGAGRTGEELQERREVFGTDALGGQRRVAQTVLVWRGQPWEVACRREGACRGGRVECVHVAERRAEQACERVLKGFPPLVDALQSSLVSQFAKNKGRSIKESRDGTYLVSRCAPSPIHAHSSAPEPIPGSPGCPHRS